MSSPAKKKKFEYQKKKFYDKSRNRHNKEFMEPGQSGFLVTCNFREKDCLRESYAVLNEYADILYGKVDEKETDATEKKSSMDVGTDSGDDEEEEDISKMLASDINKAKTDFKKKSYRFQGTDIGNVTNCLFIRAKVPDVVELGVKILTNIYETKQGQTKNVLRFIPVEIVCKANMTDIINAAGKLFDKHLLKEPKTFSIVFNHRMNNSVKRDTIIKELATLVTSKNVNNKVDLKNPQVVVMVEVLKGLCCLSVLPDYFKLRKYNLAELVVSEKVTQDSDVDDPLKEIQTADFESSKEESVE